MPDNIDYRGQVNLHLQYATRFLAAMRRGKGTDGDWGGNFAHAMGQAVAFHLGLAYRSHVADLLSQRKLEASCSCAIDLLDSAPTLVDQVPELKELAERERGDSWLLRVLRFDFLATPSASASTGNQDLLATETSNATDASALGDSLSELNSLVARHRDFMYEY